MRELQQSTTANVMVFMVLSSDHVTGATGKTLTITASKNGGAFASISPTVTEPSGGNGWYNVALTTSHTDTLGDLALHIEATDCDPSDLKCLVKVVNSQVISAVPSAASIRSEIDSNSTQLAAIVADTNELQTNQGDWLTADVSGLATAVSIAALNDFDPATETVTVGTNNDKTDYALTTAPLDAAGIRTAVGLAAANLDTQLANISGDTSAATDRKLDLHRRATIYAAGDSITLGNGASTSAQHFINIIGTQQGVTIDDTIATSGRGVWQAVKLLNALSFDKETSALHWMVGFNDLRRATNHVKTRRKVAAAISSALLAMWGDQYYHAQDASVTVGSGTYGSYNAASIGGKYSTGRTIALNAGSLTWSFTGDKFGIGFGVNSGDVETYGTADIFVDDVLVDQVNLNTWMDYVSDGSNDNRRGPMGRLITGLPYKEHTVRVVRTSSTGTVPVDYFCTILPIAECPPVMLADCPRMPAAGYALSPANSSDEQVANLNSLQREIVAHYAGLGFPISAGETGKYYDPDTEVHTDNIHPGDTGHANIARALQESMTFGSAPRQNAVFVSTFDSSIQALTSKLDTALESDGASGYQWTTLALENGPSGSGGGSTIVLPPLQTNPPKRVSKTDITVFNDETPTVALEIYDPTTNEPVDVSGLGDVAVHFATLAKAHLATVPMEELSISENVVSVTIPTAVSDGLATQDRNWSLRSEADPNVVHGYGKIRMQYAATKAPA